MYTYTCIYMCIYIYIYISVAPCSGVACHARTCRSQSLSFRAFDVTCQSTLRLAVPCRGVEKRASYQSCGGAPNSNLPHQAYHLNEDAGPSAGLGGNAQTALGHRRRRGAWAVGPRRGKGGKDKFGWGHIEIRDQDPTEAYTTKPQ